jgi:hypothetical protein
MKSLGVQGHFYYAATHFSMFGRKSDHLEVIMRMCALEKKSLFEKISVNKAFYIYYNIHDALLLILLLLLFCVYMI